MRVEDLLYGASEGERADGFVSGSGAVVEPYERSIHIIIFSLGEEVDGLVERSGLVTDLAIDLEDAGCNSLARQGDMGWIGQGKLVDRVAQLSGEVEETRGEPNLAGASGVGLFLDQERSNAECQSVSGGARASSEGSWPRPW